MSRESETTAELKVVCAAANMRILTADGMAALAGHLMALRGEMDNLSDDEVMRIASCLLSVLPVFRTLTVFRA
jgi:hypothetical protein